MAPKSVEEEIRDEFEKGQVRHSSVNYLLALVDTLRAELRRASAEGEARGLELAALRAILPPSARGEGIVGEGSWAVFAEKVVTERDEAREKLVAAVARADGAERVVAAADALAGYAASTGGFPLTKLASEYMRARHAAKAEPRDGPQ